MNRYNQSLKIKKERMAAICKAITEKADWLRKSENPHVRKNWETELAQHDYTKEHVTVALAVLKNMRKNEKPNNSKHNYYSAEEREKYFEAFKWDIFENKCECECPTCLESEFNLKSRKIPGDPNDPELLMPTDVICKCIPKVIPARNQFLEKLVRKIPDLIPADLLSRLKTEVARLELASPDWHPFTNEQVRDLVHPSLFCYVDGVTKLRCTGPNTAKPGILQWLPSEVILTTNGPRFITEINNLPRFDNETMYEVIEEILGKFMPHLDNCMQTYLEKAPKALKNLQIIVKLASTVLTPEKPEFPGGNWHLEGNITEHIVATGIYYYDNDNVVDSGLYTRIPITEDQESDLSYPQNCFNGMPIHYLLPPSAEAPRVQHLGPVSTNQGDCLIFPNFVQHKVSTFKLDNPAKPGVRKILLFWIVDPNIRIISMQDVEKPDYTMRDAKIYRELLMYERSNGIDERNQIYESELTLCEH